MAAGIPTPDQSAGLREQGRWLIDHRHELETGESGWLDALGAFDADGGWADDGQLSCVDWLRWSTGMARSTAYEKVHLAAALRNRPQLAGAFRDGRLSYSATRLIARLDRPDDETETALIALAETATIRDLERAVDHYSYLADQERPPPDPDAHRSVRIRPDLDGWSKIEIVLPALEAAELVATLDAFMAIARREHDCDKHPASAHADDNGDPDERAEPDTTPDPPAQADDGGPDDSPTDITGSPGEGAGRSAPADGDNAPDGPEPDPSAQADDDRRTADERRAAAWRTSRGLAFTDLVRCALTHADGGHALGDDRYLVHVVARNGTLTLLDGTPVHPDQASEVLCHASVVAHTVDEHGEPLDLGRKTRTWSTAQRRAALVRDGGRCRFPGCDRRVRDLHHRQAWEDDGPTDIGNSMAVCRRHHALLHHHHFTVRTGPDGALTFQRPDGTHLGVTLPAQQRLLVAA